MKEQKSKDPAFLFYSSDFLTGTMLMSDTQVGQYIRLMCLQHQKGKLTEKDMLNICKTYDEDVFSKFKKDDHGLFYNDRLSFEIQRRIEYSASRRKNREKKNICESYDEHMETENEIENTNRNTNNKGKKKKFIPPKLDEVINFFLDKGFSREAAIKAFSTYDKNEWKDTRDNQIKDWQAKMRNVWFKDENKIPTAPVKKMVL